MRATPATVRHEELDELLLPGVAIPLRGGGDQVRLGCAAARHDDSAEHESVGVWIVSMNVLPGTRPTYMGQAAQLRVGRMLYPPRNMRSDSRWSLSIRE